MAEYTELIADLRDAEQANWKRLSLDAADAIEALQAENKKTVTQIFGEEQQEWEEYCTGLMNRIRELNAQLPKRGEWITTKYHTWECSVCRKNPTTGMGYVQTRKALYNYCPNCGAKMEVQDGQA